MARDSLNEFIKRLSLDEALQDQLLDFGMRRGLAPGQGRLSEQAIVEFAEQHGFRVTVEDLSGRNLSAELSGLRTAPLTALPQPGSRQARDSSAWWAWLEE
jgi:hypothetical protein